MSRSFPAGIRCICITAFSVRALFYERGTFSCYDPSFYCGYPKTPVFDSGSRPAEMMLLLGGGRFRPEAYKIGLALVSAAASWLLVLAARGAGLTRAAPVRPRPLASWSGGANPGAMHWKPGTSISCWHRF